MDDVASHVRLFKSARYKYKCPLKVNLHCTLLNTKADFHQYLLKEGEARPADLETIFFDFEVSHHNCQNFPGKTTKLTLNCPDLSGQNLFYQVGMEGEVCRDQVCLDSEAETQYLQVMSCYC